MSSVEAVTVPAVDYADSIEDQQVPYFGFVKIPFTNKTIIWATGYRENQFVMTDEDFYDPTPPNIIRSELLVEVLQSYREVKTRQFKNFLLIEGVE